MQVTGELVSTQLYPDRVSAAANDSIVTSHERRTRRCALPLAALYSLDTTQTVCHQKWRAQHAYSMRVSGLPALQAAWDMRLGAYHQKIYSVIILKAFTDLQHLIPVIEEGGDTVGVKV
jgi:hypothetical protein